MNLPDKILTKDGQTIIPADIKSQLPIFRILGDNLPAQVKTPEAKKTISSIIFWSAIIGGSFWFFTHMGDLLQFAQTSVLFLIWAILGISLALLSGPIIGLLNRVGRTLIFKGEKGFISKNPIETLQLLSQDASSTLKKVKDKITQVDGVKFDMIANAEEQKTEAKQKADQVKRLTEAAKKLDLEATEANSAGFKEKSNAKKREAVEARSNAQLRMAESETAEQMARQYAQYSNQFSKVVEVLKDNESGARIYVNALQSTIKIIDAKMTATNKMRNATEGLAEVFNIKDGWVFDVAMSAATTQISQNLASIKSNLDFVDQNQPIAIGSASQADLEAFVAKVDSGKLQSLNISEMSDANYDLKPEEKVDKGFNLLD